MTHWFALAALSAGLALGAGVQQLRVHAAQTAQAKTTADYAGKLARASLERADALEAARAKDKVIDNQQRALNETIATNAQAGAERDAQAEKRLALAAAGARGLREQLAAATARLNLARSKAGDAAGAAADLDAAQTTARMLAELYRRADERASAVERFADAAHRAGLACERDYQSGRAALMEASKP